MTSTRSVLLLGASGFFGPALASAFGAQVAARTYATHPIEGGLRFDARSSSVAELVAALPARPAAAVVLFGETNIDACARDPRGTAEVNVQGAMRAMRELSALGIMPVFLSSDAVFNGMHPLWTEEEEVRPILTYGRQKLEVERFVASLPAPWLIVRLPKLLSEQRDPRCMVTQWIDALGRDRRILCATDQFFTPAAASDAASAIALLVRERAQGLLHLGGPERLSRRALLGAVLEEYRYFAVPNAQIVECSLRDIPVAEARPLDTSMNTARFSSRHAFRFRPASEIARLAVRNHFARPTPG
jgi:dTDP-4-dehydrorhamnose reductase